MPDPSADEVIDPGKEMVAPGGRIVPEFGALTDKPVDVTHVSQT